MPIEMAVQRNPSGFQFSVHDVVPARTARATVKTKQAIEELLGLNVEAASDYHDDCVAEINNNPLVMSVVLAYAEHRPLVLSPDSIWATILQGFGDHIEMMGDKYSSLLCGDIDMAYSPLVCVRDFHRGSPETPWGDTVEQATIQVKDWLRPDFARLFDVEFSTTTRPEKIAFRLSLLATIKKHFSMIEGWICGIPEITLTGEVDDWRRLREAAQWLRPFDFDWWLDPLTTVLDQFVSAAEGNPDVDFWKRICRRRKSSGCHKGAVTGWIAKLFPYRYFQQRPNSRNPLLRPTTKILWYDDFPKGVREVPLRLPNGDIMRLLGGLIGISQCKETLSLRPKLGWCVVRRSSMEVLLDRIEASQWCDAPRAKSKSVHSCRNQTAFYSRFQFLRVFNGKGDTLARVRSVEENTNVTRPETANSLGILVELSDGRMIGQRMFYVDDPPFVLNGYFLMEHAEAEFADLITDDFEQLLSWLMPENGQTKTLLANVPVIERMNVLGLSRNNQDDKSQAILKVLQRLHAQN